MAADIIIGGASGTLVKYLANDIIMPPVGLQAGNVDSLKLFIVL